MHESDAISPPGSIRHAGHTSAVSGAVCARRLHQQQPSPSSSPFCVCPTMSHAYLRLLLLGYTQLLSVPVVPPTSPPARMTTCTCNNPCLKKAYLFGEMDKNFTWQKSATHTPACSYRYGQIGVRARLNSDLSHVVFCMDTNIDMLHNRSALL